MQHKTGIILLIIGGAIMIASSAIGSIGVFELLYNLALTYVSAEFIPLLTFILNIIRFIADTGGFAIIIGAFFIMINQIRIGKFIIWIGLTFGALALIVWIISQIVNYTGIITDPTILSYLNQLYGFFTYNTGLAFLGVTIAIIGRAFVKKQKKPKLVEVKESSLNTEDFL
jgi:hypothetical protein